MNKKNFDKQLKYDYFQLLRCGIWIRNKNNIAVYRCGDFNSKDELQLCESCTKR